MSHFLRQSRLGHYGDKEHLTRQCHLSAPVISSISFPAQMSWLRLSREIHVLSPTFPYNSELCALIRRWPILAPLPRSFLSRGSCQRQPTANHTDETTFMNDFSLKIKKALHFHQFTHSKSVSHLLSHLIYQKLLGGLKIMQPLQSCRGKTFLAYSEISLPKPDSVPSTFHQQNAPNSY